MTSVINILIFIFYDIGNKHTDIHVVIQKTNTTQQKVLILFARKH